MKKSYIKLIIFSSIIILFLICNGFIFKIFNTLYLSFFMLFLLLLVKIMFGFEKDNHRYTKDVMMHLLIILISFFLIYYLSGLIISFSKTGNYFTFNGLTSIILPLIFYIFVKEYLRYTLVTKSSESIPLIILICILFICFDSTVAFSINDLSLSKSTFLLFSVTFIPLITENILCTFITYNFGYKPNILYLLIIKLYPYLLPIVPNPNEYVYSMIFFLFPIVILYRLQKFIKNDRVNIEVESVKQKNYFYYIPLIFITIISVYFVSGYFKYYAIAVATGSMVPNINKGDVVIVNQKYNENDLKKGMVIAYKYNEKIVVHRIYKIIKSKDIIIYTKGDANNEVDKWKVSKDMVIGTVKQKIPIIGYPTVWLNEMK